MIKFKEQSNMTKKDNFFLDERVFPLCSKVAEFINLLFINLQLSFKNSFLQVSPKVVQFSVYGATAL